MNLKRPMTHRTVVPCVMLILMTLSAWQLPAQTYYLPQAGDLHVYTIHDGAAGGVFVNHVAPHFLSAGDTLGHLRYSTVPIAYFNHSGAATVSSGGRFIEFERFHFETGFSAPRDLYPLQEPAADTLTLFNPELPGGASLFTVTRRFDTTLFGEPTRCFTIETQDVAMTISALFGLTSARFLSRELSLSSARIGLRSYNRDNAQRTYMPICPGAGYRYDGFVSSMPAMSGDGPYGLAWVFSRDTLIGGVTYYAADDHRGRHRGYYRSDNAGVFEYDPFRGAARTIAAGDASIGSIVGHTNSLLVIDTATENVYGKERFKLVAVDPFLPLDAIADGISFTEEVWYEGIGLFSRTVDSEDFLNNVFTTDARSLSFFDACGEADGDRATAMMAPGDLRVFATQRAGTEGTLVWHAVPGGPFASDPDTLLVLRGGDEMLPLHFFSSLTFVNADGMVTALGAMNEHWELYPSIEPFQDVFVAEWPMNPALVTYVVLRRFDTTLCGAAVRAYTFASNDGLWDVEMTIADGYGLIRERSNLGEEISLAFSSGITGGVPCNRDPAVRDFMPLCIDNSYRYRGSVSTMPADAGDGPYLLDLSLANVLDEDSLEVYVCEDGTGAPVAHFAKRNDMLLRRENAMSPFRRVLDGHASLGSLALSQTGTPLLVLDTTTVDFADQRRMRIRAVSPFPLAGAIQDTRISTWEEWTDGIGLTAAETVTENNVPALRIRTDGRHVTSYAVCGTVPVRTTVTLPAAVAIHTIYPNPSSREVVISFSTPAATGVALRITDLLGRTVAENDGAAPRIGEQLFRWDGRMQDGRTAPPGFYIVSIRTESGGASGLLLRVR